MRGFLNIGALIILCMVAGIVNYRVGGATMMREGITGGLKFFLKIVPLFIVLSVLCGQIGAFYARKPEAVRSVLKGNAGIIKAACLGALVPGGVAAGEIMKKEWNEGGNKLAIIVFILAMTLINWNILVFRLPFFGEKITAWIYGIGAVITAVAVGGAILIQHFKT